MGIKDAPIPSTRSLANLIYPGCKDLICVINSMMGKSLDIKNKDIPTTSDVPDQNFKGPF